MTIIITSQRRCNHTDIIINIMKQLLIGSFVGVGKGNTSIIDDRKEGQRQSPSK